VVFCLEFQAIKEDFDVDGLHEHQAESEEHKHSSYNEEQLLLGLGVVLLRHEDDHQALSQGNDS
jgi:hypothetical protein